MVTVTCLNELTDPRYRRGYWQLRYFVVCWRTDGKLYWKNTSNGPWHRFGWSVTETQEKATKRLLKQQAKKENILLLTNVHHGSKVLMSHAKAITNIPIPYCMDMLMEMDHPYYD